MEHNRHCEAIGEVYGHSKLADFPFNVDNIWQKNSSQSNQYSGITISNQKARPDCRVLISHSLKQSKHIKLVVMAILNMIPQGDPDLTKKPEQQNNTFWFPTLENPGKPEDHTPIQKRILKEKIELEDKEKLNPQEETESRNKFLKRFDWTDTLLTKTEKKAIGDILVDYHDLFARHRMDILMNTEFKVKLTTNDDNAVYSQILPMSIHLKEDLNVEIALMHRNGIITVLPFSGYAIPIFAQRKPNGKIRLLGDLRKTNSRIADD